MRDEADGRRHADPDDDDDRDRADPAADARLARRDEGDGERPPPEPAETLAERFPELRPIAGPPTLVTFQSLGTMVYGRRDADPATGTYVKSRCLVALAVPILWLDAYRVADAPSGGWFFLGRVPLSGLARAWNVLVLAAIIVFGGGALWRSHTSTPEYAAGQRLSEADAIAGSDPVRAAELYAELAGGPAQGEGAARLGRLCDREADRLDLAALADIVGVVAASSYGDGVLTDARCERLAAAAGRRAAESPHAALALLDRLEPRRLGFAERRALREARGGAAHPDDAPRVAALEALLASDPDQLSARVGLALAYEQRADLARAEALLAPASDGLGDTEGARILGSILLRRGQVEAALGLLAPYVEARLERLPAVERAYGEAREAAWRRAVRRLEDGAAQPEWYRRYDALDPKGKDRVVAEWAEAAMARDPVLSAGRRAFEEGARVVPAALDLGILRLQRAQGIGDEALRRAELEAAERVFSAIQGVAGGDLDLQLQRVRVSYWLGKPAEGRALLEQALAASERGAQTLIAVASVLRELGFDAEAMACLEEAYDKGSGAVRFQAASQRAIFEGDEAKRLAWLERADPEDRAVRADIHAVRGRQALQAGDDLAAARCFRDSIEVYAGLPQSSTTINNAALVWDQLFWAGGGPEAKLRSVQMLEQAERLEPESPFLISNLARALTERAAIVLYDDALSIGAFRLTELGLVDFLVVDEATRTARHAEIAAHVDVRAALERLAKLRVMAPASQRDLGLALTILIYGGSRAAHEELARAVAAAPLARDHEQTGAEVRAHLERPVDPARLEGLARLAGRHRADLARLRAAGAAPGEVALSTALIVGAAVSRFGLGAEPDDGGRPLVQLAEEAYAGSPSEGARQALAEALALAAVARLSAGSPDFAALRDRVRRVVPPSLLVAAILADPAHPLRQRVAGDPDVRRWAALAIERHERLPSELGLTDWALLSGLDPARAAEVAAVLQADPLRILRGRLRAELEPMSAGAVLGLAWVHRIEGDGDAAAAVVEAARARGLPLP